MKISLSTIQIPSTLYVLLLLSACFSSATAQTAPNSISPRPTPTTAAPTSTPPLFGSRTPAPANRTNIGLTLELFGTSNLDFCKKPRKCYDLTGDEPLICQTSSTLCGCAPEHLFLCESSSTCDDGERCMDFGTAQICVSCEYNTNIFQGLNAVDNGAGNCKSSSSEDPCIAVDSLQGFTADQLVYPAHRRASVLCDEFNNCATAGHIVSYKDMPMMMKNYCSQHGVQCKRTVKLVNNPRMKRGMRIPSQSEHLKFSAFSARYGTSFEEYDIFHAI